MAKVIAARGRGEPPMDAFEMLGAMVPQVTALNLLAELDYSQMPERGRAWPGAAAAEAGGDLDHGGDDHLQRGQAGGAGIPLPKSLADLADPRLAGRVMIPDISSGGGLECVGAFALTAGGSLRPTSTPGWHLIRASPGCGCGRRAARW